MRSVQCCGLAATYYKQIADWRQWWAGGRGAWQKGLIVRCNESSIPLKTTLSCLCSSLVHNPRSVEHTKQQGGGALLLWSGNVMKATTCLQVKNGLCQNSSYFVFVFLQILHSTSKSIYISSTCFCQNSQFFHSIQRLS